MLAQTRVTREEYGQAYEKGFQYTIAFLMSRGVQRDAATELAQAAWVRGWECRSQLRVASFIRSWVNTIALNLYRESMRKPLVHDDGRNENGVANIDLAAIDIACVIGSCSRRDQNLLLQCMRGFTAGEIALQEHITDTAVRIRLMRARRAARAQLDRTAHLQKRRALAMAG